MVSYILEPGRLRPEKAAEPEAEPVEAQAAAEPAADVEHALCDRDDLPQMVDPVVERIFGQPGLLELPVELGPIEVGVPAHRLVVDVIRLDEQRQQLRDEGRAPVLRLRMPLWVWFPGRA